MKKLQLTLVAAAMMIASSALASLTVYVDRSYYNTGLGGEFSVLTSDPGLLSSYSPLALNPDGTRFQSFCLETTEEIADATVGYGPFSGTIDKGAVNGGYSGGNPDPISLGTAYLYYKFATGQLNYDYANAVSRLSDARLLQDCIWFLEGEYAGAYGPNSVFNTSNKYYQIVSGLFGGSVTSDANGEFGVYALNLVTRDGVQVQSQLIYLPEPSTVVAGALLLLPFGVSTLRILRKKSNS